MYRTLLVPLDGSPFAEQALPWAVSIARRANAALRIVHVHTPVAALVADSALAVASSLDVQAREGEGAYLEGVAERLSEMAPVRVTSALRDGPVAEALCAEAATAAADLVVLATHGRGPWSRFWLGSVADQLVRRLTVPVLLVRPREGGSDLAGEPVLRRVLIPLDGSDVAEQVMRPATELGGLMQAEYLLLRVVEPLIVPDRRLGGNAVAGWNPELAQAAAAGAERYLEGAAGRLRARGQTVQVRVVVNRPAPVTILEEARAGASDLIALATHGRGGAARLLLGSVADKVIRGADGPVLVVPRGAAKA
jgi:nucleotide-binding universal stress UspA family protein